MKDKIRTFIFENFLFGEPDEKLKNSDSFMEQGIIDSTGILELAGFLEENFGVKVEDSDLVPENLDSVDNIVDFINRKAADKTA